MGCRGVVQLMEGGGGEDRVPGIDPALPSTVHLRLLLSFTCSNSY